MNNHPKQTADDMAKRVMRFSELKKNPVTLMFIDSILPSHWRMNYAVIGDTASENPNFNPAIRDPHKFQIGMGWAPPGCGPAWHTHDYVEMFLVLKGSYRFYWGYNEDPDKPDGDFLIGEWDAISLPPGVWRRFENAEADQISWFFAILDPHEAFTSKDPYWPPKVVQDASNAGFTADAAGKMIKPANYAELEAEQLDKLLNIYQQIEGHAP